MAMMFQPIVRPLIPGCTPLYLVDKPEAGTGASLLVSTALYIATGVMPGTQSLPNNDDELKKTITSQYMSGAPVIFFDNVNTDLDSAHIANLATSATWQDRILGQSEIASIPNQILGVVAGNNVKARSENMRRFLPIHMDLKNDPLEERPFTCPDIGKYVQENQPDLFGALLTMVQYWINQGMPKWTGKPLPSFEGYCEVMGGILECCGIEGFLSNRHITSGDADTDKLEWSSFFQQIVEKWGIAEPRSITDITKFYADMGSEQPTLVVNGGGRVKAGDDEMQISGTMRRCLEKQVN